jgi:ubiquinone/menaquinone biosynthesis C-methylase UbiE
MDQFKGYAQFYDLDYAYFVEDLHLVQQFAARCGSPLLELGCGTGRLLLPLAAAGYQVTGVDLSPEMLEIARRKVQDQGLEGQVSLVQQDMRKLNLEDRYHMAFAAINTFMSLADTRDQVAALTRIREHLVPGGLLLLDLFNPDLCRLLDAQGQLVLEKVMAEPETGHSLIKFRSQIVDPVEQQIHVTVILDSIDSAGQVQRTLFPYSLRFLYRQELELLLEQTGFQLEALYGSYDLDKFTADSDKMIAVAVR